MAPRYRAWQYAVAAAVFLCLAVGLLGTVLIAGASTYPPAYRGTYTVIAGILAFIGIRYVTLAYRASVARSRSDLPL